MEDRRRDSKKEKRLLEISEYQFLQECLSPLILSMQIYSAVEVERKIVFSYWSLESVWFWRWCNKLRSLSKSEHPLPEQRYLTGVSILLLLRKQTS